MAGGNWPDDTEPASALVFAGAEPEEGIFIFWSDTTFGFGPPTSVGELNMIHNDATNPPTSSTPAA